MNSIDTRVYKIVLGLYRYNACLTEYPCFNENIFKSTSTVYRDKMPRPKVPTTKTKLIKRKLNKGREHDVLKVIRNIRVSNKVLM